MSSGPDVGEGSFLSGLKKVNMKKIVVDDDQEVPKHAAGGAGERALLAELDTALEGVYGASGRGKGEALRLMCLRGRKYDVSRAAELVPQCAALMDELQIGRVNDEFTTDLRSRKLTTTGARDERGRAIIWVRLRFHQPKESSPARVAKLLTTIVLRELEDAETDLSGIRISNLDPSLVHRIASSTLPRLPVRVGRVVFFNPPFLFGRIVLPIVLSLLSKKLRARVHIIHGEDFEALHRVIPPTSLTSDHRGSFAFDHEQWVADVLSAADDPRPTI